MPSLDLRSVREMYAGPAAAYPGGTSWQMIQLVEQLDSLLRRTEAMSGVIAVARQFVPRVRDGYSTHNLNTGCITHGGECSHCDFCGMPWPCETEQLRTTLATLDALGDEPCWAEMGTTPLLRRTEAMEGVVEVSHVVTGPESIVATIEDIFGLPRLPAVVGATSLADGIA